MLRNLCCAALLAVMLVVLVAGSVQAQTQANANVTASATVLTALTITTNTNVAFGNISATTAGAVYLNPQVPASSNYVGITAAVGTLTIAGATNTSIRIGWPTTVTLTSGANNMTYTLKVTGDVNNANQATSTDLTGTNPASVTTATGTDPVPGAYYLWVGGNLGTLTAQATGAYTGTANVTVEYN